MNFNPHLYSLQEQRLQEGWNVAWELPLDHAVLTVPAQPVDEPSMDTQTMLHCIVALKPESDGEEAAAQILSIHVSRENAERMLQRFEVIADSQIQLSLQSLPVEN